MNKGGRPTKYKPEYCKVIVDYFEAAEDKEIRKEVIKEEFFADGKIKHRQYMLIADNLPFFSEFERSIKVYIGSCSAWVKKEDEGLELFEGFTKAYNACKEIQKGILIKNGLAGLTNPAFTIFTAKNITDMKDKTEVDHGATSALAALLKQISEKRQKLANDGKSKA